MKRSLILIILLATVIVLDNGRRSVSAAAASPARRALLIGIGKYDSPLFPSLEFPKNDVARFGELLESPSYGFAVTRLTDESAMRPTRENILRTMQRVLVDQSNEGDIVLFYFSGHGSWVKNSLSDESDLRDETIVPADAVRPITNAAQLRDIRDKELAELFDRALAKKVKLTVIFDSCHSGSIARGDGQSKEVDGVDFDIRSRPTKSQMIKPELNGALVLTAAEDYQQASGGPYDLNGVKANYSHFTAELLQALFEVPADRQSARELFRVISSRLLAAGRSQTPTVAGDNTRLDETLLGSPLSSSGRAYAPLTYIEKDGEKKLVLAAGVADGLCDGVELRRIDRNSRKETDPKATIRIIHAGMSVSEFEVITGGKSTLQSRDAAAINPGDYFEQSTWVAKRDSKLSVWIPQAIDLTPELKKQIVAIGASASGKGFSVENEPKPGDNASIIFADVVNGRPQWKLRSDKGSVTSIGPAIEPTVVSRMLPKTAGSSRKVFINLPPTLEIRGALVRLIATQGLSLAATPEMAQYQLIGRIEQATGSVEYAWALRMAMQGTLSSVRAAQQTSLPPLTDWTNPTTSVDVASRLFSLASRLARIRDWLNITSPIVPGSSEFPYRLEIRSRGGSAKRSVEAGDTMSADREYDIYLTAARRLQRGVPGIMPEFYVYVVDIDCMGNATYLDSTGSSERYGGMRDFDPLSPPPEIPLIPANGKPLKVNAPFGTETFILLVTDRPIDRTALTFAGVRDQSGETKGSSETLDSLLYAVGAGVTSRGELSTPDTWLVQKLVVKSRAPTP